MPSNIITLDRDGPVAVLRFERPPANAINIDVCRVIADVFDEAMSAEPGAMVITGVWPFFSGGLDLKAVPTYGPQEQRELILTLNAAVAKLYSCPVPLVGAITGHAIAGGFILALCPDYRVGPTEGGLYGLTEARVGVPFPAGPMIVLQAELTPADARYITLEATNFGPEEALGRGLLDELVPPERILDRALEVAHDRATIPADAYRRIKHQVRAQAIAELERVVRDEDDPMLADWMSPQTGEASAVVLRGAKGQSPA